MALFTEDNREFQKLISDIRSVAAGLEGYAREDEIRSLERLAENFRIKTEDFHRENRKLNIGVVGQVKAGKSSFLNTLLFGGQEILPKASTPKTATLTKMEYWEENIIQIEYYSPEEWEVLEENAAVELEDEIYTSAREIVGMVRRSGVDPHPYLERGCDRVAFDTYEDLVASLNDYVGEDGRFTPIVKAVTLYLDKEEFRGLSIVDTPGLNDPIASRTIRTKEFMEVCDVVFFLSQSGSFLDKSDWILLSSQLPRKGVKRLVLIASKYDSGIRDILRKQEEDDIFGEDENVADNIPKACRIIRKKLSRRARAKVEEFVKDLEARDGSPELIRVIRQCAEPVMVSSLAHNMTGRQEGEFTPEERNLYTALGQFSDDMEADLKLLGDFDGVKTLFDEAVAEKEHILEERSRSFVPDAREELKNLLMGCLEKTNRRILLLEGNDREQLLEQKKHMEDRMGDIRADIAAVFGELQAKLESERATGIRELRAASKEYLNIKERTGSVTRQGSYTTGFLFWKKTHVYTYQEHYSYCIAADAIENLKKYAMEASNRVEEVFTGAIRIKELKRKIMNVVINNFDMGDEKYDSSLFRIMVEETVNAIGFPVFDLDISGAMDGIAGRFGGELTSAGEKTELSGALSRAVSQIYKELCGRLEEAVQALKQEMAEIGRRLEESLLTNITEEFRSLVSQCEDRDREIGHYKEYAALLQKELARA